MSIDLVTGDPEEIEREVWRVCQLLSGTLNAASVSGGYRWGTCLTLAVIEYLGERGYRVSGAADDAVAQVAGEAFRAARVAIRDAIVDAELERRLKRPRRGGRKSPSRKRDGFNPN